MKARSHESGMTTRIAGAKAAAVPEVDGREVVMVDTAVEGCIAEG